MSPSVSSGSRPAWSAAVAYGACMEPEDDDFVDDFDPWTETGATALVAAADRLAKAIRDHARTVAGLRETQQIQKVFAANDELLPLVLAYSDAQFDFTGNAGNFGPLHDFEDDDDDDDDDDVQVIQGTGLSVVSRQDFVVTDEAAILDAGKTAYRALWPDDPETCVEEDVSDLGRALYEYAHLNGWDKVKDMAGLAPVGALTVVQANEDLLRGDPDDWPEQPFLVDAPVIYSQCDVYAG